MFSLMLACLMSAPPDLPVTAAGIVTKCAYTGTDGSNQSWEKFNNNVLYTSVLVTSGPGASRVTVTYVIAPGPFAAFDCARYTVDVPGAFDPAATLVVPRDQSNPGINRKFPPTVQIN
jgi:hypothetical protein